MKAPTRLRLGIAFLVVTGALVACTQGPGATVGPSVDPAAASPSGAPPAESEAPPAASPSADGSNAPGSGGRGDYDY